MLVNGFVSHQQRQNLAFCVPSLPHFRNLYAFIIYLKVLLVIDAGPYFRMGMDPWETISTTSLVRYWFLQTT